MVDERTLGLMVDDPRFLNFERESWARLKASTPLTLSEDDLHDLKGINVNLSLKEVEEVYLPLSRYLNLYIFGIEGLARMTDAFLGKPASRTPFIIGVAGSVAVGKSTTSRILQALLSRWPDHPNVALVTTDGFLLPNRILETRGLMKRKGFPESYDQKRLLQFVADVKVGKKDLYAPIYSHDVYDIVPDEFIHISKPDILILEGLNVLQSGDKRISKSSVFVSDFFDFSIYVDAPEEDIENWYVGRFLKLRDTVFRQDHAYFQRYAKLSDDEAVTTARNIWREINLVNLRENVFPTRERANLVLEKTANHEVSRVWLRRF
ncbi:MAG: type I pantothenate kinase [Deinococcales bacterium]